MYVVFVLKEILLVFKKRGGLSYTNNVNQLLFEDLVDISRHFQVIYLCILNYTNIFLVKLLFFLLPIPALGCRTIRDVKEIVLKFILMNFLIIIKYRGKIY